MRDKAKVNKITLSDQIYIDKDDVQDDKYLLSLFTYVNGVKGDEIISNIQETEDQYIVPSNAYYKLEFQEAEDERTFEQLDYDIVFSGNLRHEQQEVVDKFFIRGKPRSGLIQAKPGWGKTFAACNLIARSKVKTLILVHTKLLYNQWLKELAAQLPQMTIGKVGDGKFQLEDITVAIYKTAHNNIAELKDFFSMVIVDEAHKCPANMFSNVVNGLTAKVKIAMTATPRRKDGKHIFLADFFTQFSVKAVDSRILAVPSVKVHQTDFRFAPIDPKRDWARTMNKLCEDSKYQEFIANLAIGYIKQGRRPLIVGERVQMLKSIQALIPKSILVIGETKDDVREAALAGLGPTYNAILSTKLFDEGISCHRLDTFISTCPNNNPTTLEQRIGRIEREHPDAQFPLVVDIWLRGPIVYRQQVARMNWYQLNGYNVL